MLDTVENVKARLAITGTTYDQFLADQVTLVSDAIEGYCRRVFLTSDWIQTFYNDDNEANYWLDLYHYPVSAVASIVEDGTTLDSSYYRLHKPSGRIIRTSGFFFAAKETVISYTAGLDDVPTPVLSVLDSIIKERYTKKTMGIDLNFGTDVQRLSIPGTISIDFDFTLANNDRTTPYGVIMGNYLNILDEYRSERAIVPGDKLVYVEADT